MGRFVFALFLLFSATAFAKDCIPFDQAAEHIGKTVCVSGKVLKVAQTNFGSFFLDFCEDYKKCPFTVVVMRKDLADVGDVRALEGKQIEITGKIKDYRGRAEIVLKDVQQLEGDAGKLPPIPKNYDADKRGSFSAGRFSGVHSKHPTSKRQSQTEPVDIDAE